MKKFLTLSFLAVGAAALASATTITVACPISGGSGVSGTATSVCNTAPAPTGFSSLDSITLAFKFDADFGLGPGSVIEDFDVNPPGNGDAFGGALDHPGTQIVTDTARGILGVLTINNPTIAEVDAALAGLTIADAWTAGAGSFNNSAFSYLIQVSYSTASAGVPEPTTLGLMGGALIGLGFVARRKRS